MSSAGPIAALVRVSTKEQSVDPQKVAIARWAKAHGYDVKAIRWYVEHGVSGAAPKRPVRDKLLKDAEKGGIKTVVVVGFDRVGRAVLPVLDFATALGESGVEFVSIREGVNTRGPAGRMVLTVFAAIAEFERALIRERIAAGLAAARKKGVHCGRHGWRWDDDSDQTLLGLVGGGVSPEKIAKENLVRAWIKKKDPKTGKTEEFARTPSPSAIRRRLEQLKS